ncbi:hypothetical protein [Mesotoga prima]|uniref:hypothetical protein n=1 Tax=Mesotoga prima TaxID=1184387 RepID=UPI002FD8C69A
MIDDFEFKNSDIVIRGNDIALVSGAEAMANAILNLVANPQGSFVPDSSYGSSLMYILASIDINMGNRADLERVLKETMNTAIARYNFGLLMYSSSDIHIHENGDLDITITTKGIDREDQFVCKIDRTGNAYKIERSW